MAGFWLWHLRLGNPLVIKAGWTALVGGLSVFYATQADGMPGRRLAIASMLGSWGARLTVFLLYDRVFSRPRRGETRSFWFCQAQALSAVFFSVPAVLAVVNPDPDFSPLEFGAAALWVVGFAGEATADRELLHFKMDPANAGRRCESGLWRFSRHPNYMFEWVMWVAYALFASASPLGWIAFLCPAAMAVILARNVLS